MKMLFLRVLMISVALIAVLVSTAFAVEVDEMEIGTCFVSVVNMSFVGLRDVSNGDMANWLCRIPVGTTNSVYEVLDDSYVRYISHEFEVSYSPIEGQPFDCLCGLIKVSRCKNCNYVYSEEVHPGEHQKEFEISIPMDCTVDTYYREFCSICGWEEIEITPAPGHVLMETYRSPSTDPTQVFFFDCEIGGFKITQCRNCDYGFSEVVPPGHDYHEVVRVEPTYQSSGTSTMECSRCKHRDYITLPALVRDDGMSDDFFLLGQTYLTGVWKLFGIYVPGFDFTFGGMYLGIVVCSISLVVLHVLFGIGGRSGSSPRTSSTNKAKISKERQGDEK